MAVWLLSIGSPLVTAAVVMVGVYFTRKSARETTLIAAETARQLEVRSQREEALTQLRWAAELAASEDPDTKRAGVDQLYAVDGSGMLDDASQVYLDAALKSAVKSLRQQVIDAGEAVEVIEADTRDTMEESTVEADQDPGGSDG